MKPLNVCIATLGALALGACAGETVTTRTATAGGGRTTEAHMSPSGEMASEERLRAFWEQNFRDFPYNARTAEKEYARFCERDPGDVSCLTPIAP